jgi:ribosomal protein S18 acetylase RimI-like enzyme
MEPSRFTRCTLTDLESLRDLSVQTFTEAFAAQNDPDDFRVYLQKAFDLDQLRKELLNPGSQFHFLWSGGELAGYSKLNTGKAQTELQHPDGMEIERIYVLKAFQGNGLGSWMLERIKTMAMEMGKTYLWLGVWEENPDAIRFYERHGFTTFGKHPYYIGSDRQMDWLMRLELTDRKAGRT